MQHSDKIKDKDAFFEVDVTTRKITNKSAKVSVIQYDHNSERFTFSLPRYIEEHDMLENTKAEVHYICMADRSPGVYEMTDLASDPDNPDNVVCSWLLSQNVTKEAGAIQFLLRFSCVAEDGTIEYAWNTAIFTGFSVSTGIYNAETIVEQYADVLEQWKNDVLVNKLTYKGKVTQLPTEDLSVGDVYEITPAVKKLYTGKVSDYFRYHLGASMTYEIESYTDHAGVFDYSSNMEYFEPDTDHLFYRAYIYDMDGNLVWSKAERDFLTKRGYSVEACRFDGNSLVLLRSELENLTGWDDELGTESEVSFYICKTRYDEGLPNGGLYLWNGYEWVDLLNTKQLEQEVDKLAERANSHDESILNLSQQMGDVETALDGIIALQESHIGGAE